MSFRDRAVAAAQAAANNKTAEAASAAQRANAELVASIPESEKQGAVSAVGSWMGRLGIDAAGVDIAFTRYYPRSGRMVSKDGYGGGWSNPQIEMTWTVQQQELDIQEQKPKKEKELKFEGSAHHNTVDWVLSVMVKIEAPQLGEDVWMPANTLEQIGYAVQQERNS